MPRLRNVGKQAANPLDIAQLRDVNAVAQTAAATYVPLTSGNQPGGYAKLDNGATPKLLNAQMPTDPSVTTLTSSGKTKAGSLEITGAASFANNATVGGSLGVTGALTAGSVDVGSGTVKAASADIPSITSANFTAKATSLDSLSVSGQSNLAALTLSGALSAQSVSATAVASSGDVTATNQVQGATLRSTGSLIVDGAASLQGVTVAGALNTQAITAAAQIRGNGGFRLGVNQTLSQVDTNNNNVPIKVAGGLDVNGPLTNVTALGLSGNLSIGGLLTVSAKATVADFESQAGGKFAGPLTGVTDLSITGNLSVQGSGKQISATALSVGTLTALSTSSLQGVSAASLTVSGALNGNGATTFTQAVTVGAATSDNHAMRRRQSLPMVHGRYGPTHDIPRASIKTIDLSSWGSNDGLVTLVTDGDGRNQYRLNRSGTWMIVFSAKYNYREDSGTKSIIIYQTDDGTSSNANRISGAATATWEGALSCSYIGYFSANTVVWPAGYQTTPTSKGNLGWETGVGVTFQMVWLRD